MQIYSQVDTTAGCWLAATFTKSTLLLLVQLSPAVNAVRIVLFLVVTSPQSTPHQLQFNSRYLQARSPG